LIRSTTPDRPDLFDWQGQSIRSGRHTAHDILCGRQHVLGVIVAAFGRARSPAATMIGPKQKPRRAIVRTVGPVKPERATKEVIAFKRAADRFVTSGKQP
jgi:hypothetical protein